MIAVKDVALKLSATWRDDSAEYEWNNPYLWYDRQFGVPLETKLHDVLQGRNCQNIVDFLGCRVYPERGAWRLYLEFCPSSDLSRLLNKYHAAKRPLPEPFLWYVFLALARACVAMEHVGEEWRGLPNETDIVHLDLKASNGE